MIAAAPFYTTVLRRRILRTLTTVPAPAQTAHPCRGTILGTTAVVSKVLLTNSQAIDWGLLPRALMGLLALLCGNGYIVGINQIYDVDIDAVNKPFLPVAAGELCMLAAGEVDSITRPDGTASPCSMQHADDTTLHAASRHGASVLLHRAVVQQAGH
jgi:hypothetical protein